MPLHCFPMTRLMPPKSTTLPRQLLPPFTTSHCQMFYPLAPPINSVKVLTGTTHPKLLTTLKVPKKKKKKQKDEWNKSTDVSDDEDQALQPQSIFNDPKSLQAAVTSAMKSNLTEWIIELLNFPVSPMYKLAI
uniref:Uncharacterized protein n=1 Tax=Romanomermis culicivorax TaxID=13658 RepID=A0A915L768_ROMCU